MTFTIDPTIPTGDPSSFQGRRKPDATRGCGGATLTAKAEADTYSEADLDHDGVGAVARAALARLGERVSRER